jgi:hypothetical protein
MPERKPRPRGETQKGNAAAGAAAVVNGLLMEFLLIGANNDILV